MTSRLAARSLTTAAAAFAVCGAMIGCGSSGGGGSPGASSVDASMGSGGDSGSPAIDASVGDVTSPSEASLGDAGVDAAAVPCPSGMVPIATTTGPALVYCIDAWEAYVVEVDDAGVEHPHSPYDVVDGLTVRAKTASGAVPQGYISQVEATAACALAGKRLCSPAEFHQACEGPGWADGGTDYPYGGQTHIPGDCNEGKGSYMPYLFGNNAANWTYADFNDPRVNQIDGGLFPSGSFPHCESPYGIFDCVGNLHEWGNDPADANGHGRFRGGFYGDAEINGHGCLYVTSAHALSYHDYSTGFRCCADASGGGG